MKPLIVLILVFLISAISLKLTGSNYGFAMSVRIALSAMLVFTAISHFVFTKGMMMMLPEFIPFKRGMIYFTGIVEIAAAIGIQIPSLKVLTGWLLILFFLMIFPANIQAARQRIDLQKGDYSGDGLNYLWFRIPLQILFILLTYFSAIRF